MTMSLLHAAAALLTVLLLLVQGQALAAVCSKSFKHRHSLKDQRDYVESEFFCKRPKEVSHKMMNRAQRASFVGPKYKKDPEIHIDDEGIGQHPYED